MPHPLPLRRPHAVAGLLALGSCLSVHLSGCSLIGLAGGAIVDARRPDTTLMPTGRMHAFRVGDSLTLVLRDTTRISGRYAGVSRMSDEVYRARWARLREERGGPPLPRPGAYVRVVRSGRDLASGGGGEFLAFTLDAIEIRDRRGAVKALPLRAVDEIRWDDGRARLSHGDLEQLRLAGGLPLAASITIDADGTAVTVPLDDVAWVWGPTMKDAARKGFVLGLAADAVIVATAIAVAASYRGPFEGSNCEASPGTVYSVRMHERMRHAAATAVDGAEP
jgi:hypothetical protein